MDIKKGILLRNLEKYEDAITCSDKTVELDPEDKYVNDILKDIRLYIWINAKIEEDRKYMTAMEEWYKKKDQ